MQPIQGDLGPEGSDPTPSSTVSLPEDEIEDNNTEDLGADEDDEADDVDDADEEFDDEFDNDIDEDDDDEEAADGDEDDDEQGDEFEDEEDQATPSPGSMPAMRNTDRWSLSLTYPTNTPSYEFDTTTSPEPTTEPTTEPTPTMPEDWPMTSNASTEPTGPTTEPLTKPTSSTPSEDWPMESVTEDHKFWNWVFSGIINGVMTFTHFLFGPWPVKPSAEFNSTAEFNGTMNQNDTGYEHTIHV